MPLRTLFINSGILGHASVARLLREAASRDADIAAEHLDLSAELTPRERIIRGLMCAGPAPGSVAGALTGARLRHELHAGVLAARRIRAREVARAGWDVLHFHTQAAAYASLPRMRHTPSVVSIDITQRLASAEVPAGLARLEYAPNAAWDRAVFHAAAAVIATSRWAADDVIRAQPGLSGRVHAMPYPVPLDGFDPAWMAERTARAASDPVRVLFIGGDWARKGGPQLLDAWRAGGFADRAVLDVVTDWPGVSALDAGGLRVHRGVRAYTPEWFERWRDADVFVMPTRGEAFGMVYQEAAAAGLPAIGTRMNAIPELVQHASTGLLVDPDDGRALRQALDRLVGDAALRARLGTAARARIERTGSMQAYADRLSAILHAAAGNRRQHPSAGAEG